MNDKLPAAPVVTGADLSAGGSVRAIVPRDFEAAYRLAQVVVKAGMAPKSIDTVEKACVAIMHGLEVGLTPMAALQSIAVVNGMPTIYGDGMLALIRNSGLLESIDETVEIDDQGEPTIAICRVRRKGDPNETVGTFSRVEAQRAGLWNKAGPWTQYRPRMMKMRARSWALRDKFADVLRGLGMAEEIEDVPLDVTKRGEAHFAPPEPKRSDASDVQAGPAEARPTAHERAAATAAASDAAKAAAPTAEAGSAPPSKNWSLPDDLVGQDAVVKALNELLGMTETAAEIDELERQNAARIAKITGNRRADWNAVVKAQRSKVS